MAATEEELEVFRRAIADKQSEVEKQGEIVKALKGNKKPVGEINEAVELLKNLKVELQARTKEFSTMFAETHGKGKSDDKENFRQVLSDTLTRRLFFIPAFKIYGGVAGLYDYGPPGCAVKANVLSLWRQHYVLEEAMLEVDCPCVTPEVVLKASGHVDKFTDLMVKDEHTGAPYRADHLLKGYIENAFENDVLLSAAKRQELKEVLATLDELNAEQLGAKLKEYNVTAPDTKNSLSDPFPFNLMFGTQIGPTGSNQGYLRPETAQGIFVNFRDLYYYNGSKLPFAAAQIGQAFRNEVNAHYFDCGLLACRVVFGNMQALEGYARWDEKHWFSTMPLSFTLAGNKWHNLSSKQIAPRQGLLRVREFTLAEIEHFVDPDDKSHPKFKDVANLEFLLYPREEQLKMKKPLITCIGVAVKKGIVNNETLGYFIARTYLFLTMIGIDKNRLRFRQHLPNEMAHYAADCWDAEIECSYGWIEVTGLADRSAFDLKAHTEKSKIDLTAYEAYAEPKDVEKLKILPRRQLLGPAFKKDAKIVGEALEAMSEVEAMQMKEKLEANGTAVLEICTTGQVFTVTKEQVSISKETIKENGKRFTPGVIEPSFGIGRIIYCLYEHSFYTRPSKAGDEQLVVFRFPPIVAPIKCTVFPLVQDEDLNAVAREISISLTRAGVASKIDLTGTSIGKRYARTDELGVPFAVTVDFEFKQTVTLRERDSRAQVRVPVSEIKDVVCYVAEGNLSWDKVQLKYPAVSSVPSLQLDIQSAALPSLGLV